MSGLVLSLPESGTGEGAVIDVSGGVIGPGSTGDNRIAVFDGTGGDQIQDGGQTIAQVIAAAVNQATEAVADGEVAHAATHAAGADDELSVATLAGTLAVAHGGTGRVTIGSGLVVGSGTSPVGVISGAANTVLVGTGLNVEPTFGVVPAHATRHQSGGADAIALDTLGAPTDITTHNATTLRHGLLKKLSGFNNHFLDGTGTFREFGATDITTTALPDHAFLHGPGGADELRIDATAAPIDSTWNNASTSAHGLLKKLPGVPSQFIDGTGTWRVIASGDLPDDGTYARLAADEVVTGQYSFEGDATFLNHATAVQLYLHETEGPTNEKWWRIIASGGDLSIQTFDDALGSPNTPLKITRSGALSETIVLSTNSLARTTLNSDGLLDHAYGVAFSGQGGGLLSADETVWNPTGLGTAYLLQVLSTNNWIIRGIHEQAPGYTVVVRSRHTNSYNITITHDDAAAIAQDRIMCPGSANFTLAAGHSVTLMYDGFGSHWLVIGNTM